MKSASSKSSVHFWQYGCDVVVIMISERHVFQPSLVLVDLVCKSSMIWHDLTALLIADYSWQEMMGEEQYWTTMQARFDLTFGFISNNK